MVAGMTRGTIITDLVTGQRYYQGRGASLAVLGRGKSWIQADELNRVLTVGRVLIWHPDGTEEIR